MRAGRSAKFSTQTAWRVTVLAVLLGYTHLLFSGGIATASTASRGYAYDTSPPYDGAAHSAQARTSATTPVGMQDGVDGLRERAATAAGPFHVVFAKCVAAESVPEGVVYRRTDLLGGKPPIDKAKSEARNVSRQSEHSRANPDADVEFEIIGRADPGTELDRMEEFFIRQEGGPTNVGNPNGGLANRRHQMNDSRYLGAGGDLW